MLCQGSMACFAVHVGVLAFALYVQHVAVAGFASLVSSEFHWPGCNLSNGRAAIVSILPEARWNHVVSNDQKNDEGENEESRESE